MSFYSELADTANEILLEFGQGITVTNLGMSVEDPLTGIATQESNTFSSVGVLLDYDYRNFGERSVPYHATSATDKRIVMKADKVVNTGDIITVDGEPYTANVVKLVNPAGTRVLYDIWIQK